MNIDFATLTEYQRYKLMASLIVPRPIALVTTLGPDGTVNAAPFSMFNMVGEEPPLVMISLNRRADTSLKDTAINIGRTGEFVVHLADEAIAHQMDRCGEQHPPDVSEVDVVGFTTLPSQVVAPPRIAQAPVAFECTLFEKLETASRQIFFGQVRWMHTRDGLIDTDTWRVRLESYFPVGRFGGSLYLRTRDRFMLDADGTEQQTSIDSI
ncbi:flavin reductase family protein [Variovorax ginsengisoli]|uniref:Flavin reductase (DIM6/NTAB) family NADH-FMN oxidoreductase RutF n=1 Tax=Variovorax ginsengisoli TaxID=363844 RepID=A0ABT9SAI5_9BURK|nr:flavin reductase family protein [Variovorax ginsengisoli]MDP9901380.1 flavin reductase (DIM6/NTAB) family NADH-FMN oxidoreductase RutF [Variovorax ginsengisoli]